VLILLASGYRRFGTIRFYAVPSLYGSALLLLIAFEYWIASCSLYYVPSRYIFCFGTRSLCALCHVTFLCRSEVFRLRRVPCFRFASILFRCVFSQCFGCVTKGFFARIFKSDWHTLKFLALEYFVNFHCIPLCFVCCTNNTPFITMVSKTSLPPWTVEKYKEKYGRFGTRK